MTTASEATPHSVTSKDSTTDNRSGRVLALVLAAQFMVLLDIFIVNVAAPTLRSELGASGVGLQLVLAAVAVGLLMRDGGPALYVAFAVMGVGMALGFGPTLTRALADVRPKDAADASGARVTVTRLGQLTGVAVVGTLYLNRLDAQGAQGSGRALWVCALALFVAAVAGAAAGLVRRR
ncbi:hypothetical protein [Streptomyces sp. JV185]|uniref:hypothetical protein n=1 Tax=Streptomyces sp. JV185 TaxID=858638 RepID=UPI003FA76FDC